MVDQSGTTIMSGEYLDAAILLNACNEQLGLGVYERQFGIRIRKFHPDDASNAEVGQGDRPWMVLPQNCTGDCRWNPAKHGFRGDIWQDELHII